MKEYAQNPKQPQKPPASDGGSLGTNPPASRVPWFFATPVRLRANRAGHAPGDATEQEAEHVAGQVVRMPQPQVQRTCACGGGCPACLAGQARSRDESTPAIEAPPAVHQALGSTGQAMDASTRAFMEMRFGRDFGQVRVHTGPLASQAARAVAAQAFTVGGHIVFGDGHYSPTSTAGRQLLAHELAHVLQQRAGATALQRRAANCPAAPPSPPTVNSMADFIELVRRVEASTPTGSDPVATARLISRTKYDGRAWDWMLPSTRGQAGVAAGGTVTPADIGSLCFKLIVTVPGGGQEDPMHLVAAIVADAETQRAGTGATGLSTLVRPLPASVSQRGASTWVGDVGKAAAYWMTAYPLRGGGTTMADYMRDDAPPHDLMADVDGVALTSRSASNGFAFDRTRPLSENLQRFFTPAPRTGRERRFHVFCNTEGFGLEADGVTLSAAAQATIRERVRDFAAWLQSSDPTLLGHIWERGESAGYGLLLDRRKDDWRWFADRFIEFVQTNLTAEGQ